MFGKDEHRMKSLLRLATALRNLGSVLSRVKHTWGVTPIFSVTCGICYFKTGYCTETRTFSRIFWSIRRPESLCTSQKMACAWSQQSMPNQHVNSNPISMPLNEEGVCHDSRICAICKSVTMNERRLNQNYLSCTLLSRINTVRIRL